MRRQLRWPLAARGLPRPSPGCARGDGAMSQGPGVLGTVRLAASGHAQRCEPPFLPCPPPWARFLHTGRACYARAELKKAGVQPD